MAPMLYTLYGFAIFFFIFWCVLWLLHLIAIVYGKWKLHHRDIQTPREVPYAGVSIIKPLMGVDPNLFVNLETFFTMNYPKYELLFCIENESDPAVMIVKQLFEKYPKVDCTLFIGGCEVGVNPKINNMEPGYEAAKYEFVLISDSGIRSLYRKNFRQNCNIVGPDAGAFKNERKSQAWETYYLDRSNMKEDTLLDMMHHMRDDVALVHQLPFTCDRDGFAATFEKVFFGTVQARIYLAADLLRINCHTGMSALMRKQLLDDVGGLRAFGCYLAEDFFMAKSFKDRGWRICISSQPAWQNAGICDVTSFQARLTRWAKLRVAMLPPTIILEPLSECMVIGMCASWAVSLLFSWDSVVFYMIHVLVWFLLDWILLSIVQNGPLTFHKFDFVVAWMFRECSGPYLFLHALWDPTIRWRSRVFKLDWGGIAHELKTRIKY